MRIKSLNSSVNFKNFLDLSALFHLSGCTYPHQFQMLFELHAQNHRFNAGEWFFLPRSIPAFQT